MKVLALDITYRSDIVEHHNDIAVVGAHGTLVGRLIGTLYQILVSFLFLLPFSLISLLLV